MLYRVENANLERVDEFDDANLSFEVSTFSTLYMNPVEEALHFEQAPLTQLKPGEAIRALIAMQQTNTDSSAHDLSIHQRKCIFGREMSLKYFKDDPYSITGCLKECKLEQALRICGCVPPFYRSNDLRNVTHCDIQSLKCLKDEKVWNVRQCRHCELSCDFTTFSVENLERSKKQPARVDIRMMQWPVLSFRREVRFGFVDFLVAFGSILTLFLGFSLLSAIELLLHIIQLLVSKICPRSPKEQIPSAK